MINVGPEGGDGGGTIMAQGTPEDIAASGGESCGAVLARGVAAAAGGAGGGDDSGGREGAEGENEAGAKGGGRVMP